MQKLKILFLSANPTDTSQLQLDEESHAIEQALRRGKYWDHFQVEQHWAVRISDLQALLLDTRPHIVHFSGHGSKNSEIILQNEQGKAQPVPQQALKVLFALLKGNIRCVVLNACYSQKQAEGIASSIDAVIGMSDAIGDKAAIRFSASFYQALAFGQNVDKAFELGRNQLDLENLGEQDKPQLLATRTNPKTIYLLESGSADNPQQDSSRSQNSHSESTGARNGTRKSRFIFALALFLGFSAIISSHISNHYRDNCPPPFVHDAKPDFDQKMIKIPPAVFEMGSRSDKHIPPKKVTLSGYYLDKYEVTNEQYSRFIHATGHAEKHDYPLGAQFHPVTGVLHKDAIAYCAWVQKRLPSDAEWEHACRGEQNHLYPWGNHFKPEKANVGARCMGTHTVGSFSARGGDSSYGVADLMGNVAEWTSTTIAARTVETDTKQTLVIPKQIIIKGSAFNLAGDHSLNSSEQIRGKEFTASDKIGFRCAKDLKHP